MEDKQLRKADPDRADKPPPSGKIVDKESPLFSATSTDCVLCPSWRH